MKRETKPAKNSSPVLCEQENPLINRRSCLKAGAAASITALAPTALMHSVFAASDRPRFQRIPVQYIAALASSEASRGDNAQQWGIWRKDPGPRGVPLDYYETLRANNNIAPAKWAFDPAGWWLEEHGLIMEPPEFPLSAGHYLVTGSREKSAMLTIDPPAPDGSQAWALDNDANIYDVTHLRCRSAIYTATNDSDSCTPALAKQSDYPVTPGAPMPPVEGCNKLDYMVLIVFALSEDLIKQNA